MTSTAMQPYCSIAVKAANGRSARALGVGVSMRTPVAKRQPAALCASFVELDLT